MKLLGRELESPPAFSYMAATAGPAAFLKDIGETQLAIQKAANVAWNGATFEAIQNLRPDYSGKVGELLLTRLCENGGLRVSYEGDANIAATDGTYDAKITWLTEKKDEIKTAWRGSNGSFQHESMRAKGCDQTIFIDIAPSYYYITILAKFDMTVAHPVIGRKPHLRKGTTDVYKFDFSEMNIQRAIDAGLSIKVDAATTSDAVVDFLKRFH